MRRARLGGPALLCLLALACGRAPARPDPADGAPAAPADAGGVTFTDVAASAGVTLFVAAGNVEKHHLLESTGSGVAVADYDGDGDEDLYVCTQQTTDDWLAGRRPRRNALYRNEGNGTYVDVAERAGVALAAWSNGAYFADVDEDGDSDLFVTTWGPDVFYRNRGDGTFEEATARAGLAGDPTSWSASAAFGDLDGDGDLDLYVTNYCVYDLANPPLEGKKAPWKGLMIFPGPIGLEAEADLLFENDGKGRFTEVSKKAGVDDRTRPVYGLGVVMTDLDLDGDLDVYVANDSRGNYLWRNDGGMRFTEIAALAGVATNEDAKEQAGMGTDAADVDGDGLPELVVTNFSHDWNTLYRNQRNLAFRDGTFEAGFKDSYLYLAWGTKFFDYDLDGKLDLFVANGHIYPEVDAHPQLGTTYKQRNLLYRGRGDGTFAEVGAAAGPGMAIVESTRGAAVTDMDRDGDLDLALVNADAPPNLLRNDGGNARAWVALRLRGAAPRDATGARVTVTAGGRKQVLEVNPYGSYLSTSTATLHVGLGDADSVEAVEIRWPSGKVETVAGLPVRRFVTIEEGRGVVAADAPAR
jgi:hypothetical protein